MKKALLFSLCFLITGMSQQSFGMDTLARKMAAMHLQTTQSTSSQTKPTHSFAFVCPTCSKSNCPFGIPKAQLIPKKTDDSKMSDEK